jgi:preprotein translocase subunit SecY
LHKDTGVFHILKWGFMMLSFAVSSWKCYKCFLWIWVNFVIIFSFTFFWNVVAFNGKDIEGNSVQFCKAGYPYWVSKIQ